MKSLSHHQNKPEPPDASQNATAWLNVSAGFILKLHIFIYMEYLNHRMQIQQNTLHAKHPQCTALDLILHFQCDEWTRRLIFWQMSWLDCQRQSKIYNWFRFWLDSIKHATWRCHVTTRTYYSLKKYKLHFECRCIRKPTR